MTEVSLIKRKRWSRKQVLWALAIAVLATALALLVSVNLIGPEKRLRQLPPHAYSVTDRQFRREMAVALGPTILDGNRVEALQNGDEIFPAMLQAIAAAQRSITFETYIYWSGRIGQQFSAALSERARAGVRVHVTLDWLGSTKMDEELLRQMRQAGVRIEQYRPIRWYTWDRLNNRTHRKLLVVDGRVAFTGGVGIADQWLGHAQDAEHWRESHFRVEGPVVGQFQAAFNDNWIKMTGQALRGPEYFPPLAPVGSTEAQLFLSSPASGSESMHLMYLMAIAASDREIDLAASYFVPDDLILLALLQARHRGVRIRILVPGAHTDSEVVRYASKAQWGRLLDAGVEFYEYRPTMMHVKLLIVDGEFVSVGSTNFDIRSFRLNDEASLNLFDREFAGRMQAVFERDLEDSSVYTAAMWRERPLGQRIGELLVRPLRAQL